MSKKKDDITSLDSDFLLGTLQVYADGSYQVEMWCPVDDFVHSAAEAVEDLCNNAEEARKESRKQGYEE